MQRLKSSRMSGCDASTGRFGKKWSRSRGQHAEVVGHRLQQAVAALLAGRAEVVALDEQHLHQACAGSRSASRCCSRPPCRRCGRHRAGSGRAAVDLHRADLAAAVRLEVRVVAEVRDVDAGGERPPASRSARARRAPRSPSSRKVERFGRAFILGLPDARRRRRGRSSHAPGQGAVEVEGGLEVAAIAAGARRPAGTACMVSNSGLQAVWPRPQWLDGLQQRLSLADAVEVVLRALARHGACP